MYGSSSPRVEEVVYYLWKDLSMYTPLLLLTKATSKHVIG